MGRRVGPRPGVVPWGAALFGAVACGRVGFVQAGLEDAGLRDVIAVDRASDGAVDRDPPDATQDGADGGDSAPDCAPMPESCNGLDDDCDGVADDDADGSLCGPVEACMPGALGVLPWCSGAGVYRREFISDTSDGSAIGVAAAAAFGPDGALVLAGYLAGTADFGAGPVTGGSSGRPLFLVKYAADGAWLWERVMPGEPTVEVADLTADADGRILLSGQFFRTADFGGGPRESATTVGAFVVGYAADGGYLWDHAYAAAAARHGRGVGTAPDGSIRALVQFTGTQDFGGGDRSAGVSQAAAVVALDDDGTWLWDRVYPAVNGAALDTDADGSFVLTGLYTGAVDFGGGVRSQIPGASFSCFVAKLDSAGAYLWDRTYGNCAPRAVVVGAGDHHVTLAGGLVGPTDLGDGGVSLGSEGIFVLTLTPDGAFAWKGAFAGASDTTVPGWSVARSSAGRVWLAAHAMAAVDFGGGALAFGGGSDGVLAAFDAAGGHRWSRGFGGPGRDFLYGLAERDGLVVAGGSFEGVVDLGGGTRAAGLGSDPFAVVVGD